MRKLWYVLLLSGGILLAQNNNPSATSQRKPRGSKGELTVQGCVGRFSGDYTY